MGSCTGDFHWSCDKDNLKKVVMDQGLRTVHHGSHSGKGLRQPAIHIVSIYSNKWYCLAQFLIFSQSDTPAHGMVLPTDRMGLPISTESG